MHDFDAAFQKANRWARPGGQAPLARKARREGARSARSRRLCARAPNGVNDCWRIREGSGRRWLEACGEAEWRWLMTPSNRGIQ